MSQRFEFIKGDDHYGTLVAEFDGEVIGMGGVMLGRAFEFYGIYARLIALVVAPRCRGNGVGRKLLAACEDWARWHSAHRIMLNSGRQRAQAHDFYQSAGYEDTGLRFVKSLEPEPGAFL